MDCSQDGAQVASNLIQIAAGEQEINRRIDCFVQKKREEIDLHNIMDFTTATHSEDTAAQNSTCARTDSIIIKQEQSKCHLRGMVWLSCHLDCFFCSLIASLKCLYY